MIEKILRTLLLESHELKAVVGEGIWASYIPGNTPPQPVLIIRKIGEDPEYSLRNQLGTTEAIVQIDCYHETPSRSRRLSKLVNRKISGMLRRTVEWLDEGELRRDMIYSVVKETGNSLPETPRDASDRWKHRYMLTYRVFYQIDAPTHT